MKSSLYTQWPNVWYQVWVVSYTVLTFFLQGKFSNWLVHQCTCMYSTVHVMVICQINIADAKWVTAFWLSSWQIPSWAVKYVLWFGALNTFLWYQVNFIIKLIVLCIIYLMHYFVIIILHIYGPCQSNRNRVCVSYMYCEACFTITWVQVLLPKASFNECDDVN